MKMVVLQKDLHCHEMSSSIFEYALHTSCDSLRLWTPRTNRKQLHTRGLDLQFVLQLLSLYLLVTCKQRCRFVRIVQRDSSKIYCAQVSYGFQLLHTNFIGIPVIAHNFIDIFQFLRISS